MCSLMSQGLCTEYGETFSLVGARKRHPTNEPLIARYCKIIASRSSRLVKSVTATSLIPRREYNEAIEIRGKHTSRTTLGNAYENSKDSEAMSQPISQDLKNKLNSIPPDDWSAHNKEVLSYV
jgi:hypothetical protein